LAHRSEPLQYRLYTLERDCQPVQRSYPRPLLLGSDRGRSAGLPHHSGGKYSGASADLPHGSPGRRTGRMSTVVEKPQAANPFQAPRTAHDARRRAANYAIIVLSLLATAFAVAVLMYLLLYVLRQGAPYINLDLFTRIPSA